MQWENTETLPNFAYSILLYTSSQTAGHFLPNTDARLATGNCTVNYKQLNMCTVLFSLTQAHLPILSTKYKQFESL
jgi:hypothetical protein